MNTINEVYQRICEEGHYAGKFEIICNGRIIMMKNQNYLIYADQYLVKVTCQKRFLLWSYSQSISNEYLQDFDQMYREITLLADQLVASQAVAAYPQAPIALEKVHSFS